ncbi:hypothetical protein ACUNHQ_10685 [Serratia sp. IR-2025]
MVDFVGSAKRHYTDAGILEAQQRVENAGQLYGFFAECSLKALMIANGYPVDANGSPLRSKRGPHLRKHIHEICLLINQIDATFCNRKSSNYLSMIPNINDFGDWDIDHRYCSTTEIPQSLEKWKAACQQIITMMQKADLDGVFQ